MKRTALNDSDEILRRSWRQFKVETVGFRRMDLTVLFSVELSGADFRLLLSAIVVEFVSQLGATVGQDRDGEQRSICCSGLSDCQRAHGNSGRHLHGREQRIETVKRITLHRYAEHGQCCIRGDDAGKMRGATGRRDDDLDSVRFGGACVLRYERRSAMGRHHMAFVRDIELIESFGSGTHRLPIRFAAHDYRDKGWRICGYGFWHV